MVQSQLVKTRGSLVEVQTMDRKFIESLQSETRKNILDVQLKSGHFPMATTKRSPRLYLLVATVLAWDYIPWILTFVDKCSKQTKI